MASERPTKIAYLVHNLNDAAVHRRVALLEAGGADVTVAGFHRDAAIPRRIGSAPATPLGRTADGALAQRILRILVRAVAPRQLSALVAGADVVLARNLETLVLARWLLRPGQRLVYECLDIHRLLLRTGPVSWLLHRLEAWALRRVGLVVVSAPAFRDIYFRERIGYTAPVMLVENLVPALDDDPAQVSVPAPPPPYAVGWFGMLRCRRSFELLKALAAGSGGRVKVVIAGRPSTDLFADFEAEAAAAPGVTFLGGYSAQDLSKLFGRIHFIWAIDYFEEGLNSAWLLPNRLYEGIAHGAVPIALRGVATATWLAEQGAGVLLDDPSSELQPLLEQLTPQEYTELRAAVEQVPRSAVTMNREQAKAITDAIRGPA